VGTPLEAGSPPKEPPPEGYSARSTRLANLVPEASGSWWAPRSSNPWWSGGRVRRPARLWWRASELQPVTPLRSANDYGRGWPDSGDRFSGRVLPGCSSPHATAPARMEVGIRCSPVRRGRDGSGQRLIARLVLIDLVRRERTTARFSPASSRRAAPPGLAEPGLSRGCPASRWDRCDGDRRTPSGCPRRASASASGTAEEGRSLRSRARGPVAR